MGCPVTWCSLLQLYMATSTMTSEYIALSMSLCAAIPLMEVTEAINKGLQFIHNRLSTFKATVNEDNMCALWLS